MPGSRSNWLMSAPVSATNPKVDTPLFPYLARLIRGEDLSATDAANMFRAMTDVKSEPARLAEKKSIISGMARNKLKRLI